MRFRVAERAARPARVVGLVVVVTAALAWQAASASRDGPSSAVGHRHAAASGVPVTVDSGWRSRAYQARLLREAVTRYGSLPAARRWVATADTSAHVKGEAVDLGPPDGAAWLGDHGPAFGLCRVYVNEPWHFERRPGAATAGCPAPYADPTQDPRLQS